MLSHSDNYQANAIEAYKKEVIPQAHTMQTNPLHRKEEPQNNNSH